LAFHKAKRRARFRVFGGMNHDEGFAFVGNGKGYIGLLNFDEELLKSFGEVVYG
jgi:hypothetical protein